MPITHSVQIDKVSLCRLPVRGHNMFWGVADNTPAWVLQETADQLNATIIERTKFMTGITKGK